MCEWPAVPAGPVGYKRVVCINCTAGTWGVTREPLAGLRLPECCPAAPTPRGVVRMHAVRPQQVGDRRGQGTKPGVPNRACPLTDAIRPAGAVGLCLLPRSGTYSPTSDRQNHTTDGASHTSPRPHMDVQVSIPGQSGSTCPSNYSTTTTNGVNILNTACLWWINYKWVVLNNNRRHGPMQ